MAYPTTNATVRFTIPDPSVTKDDRAVFAPIAATEARNVELPLYDMRTDDRLEQGGAGLDAQGFTVVKHHSSLTDSDQWFSTKAVAEIYLKEVCELVCQVTGANRAVIVNAAGRNKLIEDGRDPKFFYRKGHPIEKILLALPRDIPLTMGAEIGSGLEPLQSAHIDYSLKGLQATIRECRRDITAAAKAAIEAEDANATGAHRRVPRYAAYSVWRPVKQIQRDPLVLCDIRTIDKDEISNYDYRAISETNASGEYTLEYLHINPPKDPQKPRWYWAPDMGPEEVLIFKFADSHSAIDKSIAIGCPHTSAQIHGTEDVTEPRCSIECRVVAFWDD